MAKKEQENFWQKELLLELQTRKNNSEEFEEARLVL